MSRLVESKVIFIERNDYAFNKDYDQWQVPRVKPYIPDKLTELVRLNLNHTYQNSKFFMTESVSPKEILNRDKNKDDTHLDINSLLRPEEAQKTWEAGQSITRPANPNKDKGGY